ncbi:MAG TPA: AAA family ATPase, partial [candidate division Zixibacteria bacterium]|nr:AAA family ATPase [candidate division Zixibacteria bacterium]
MRFSDDTQAAEYLGAAAEKIKEQIHKRIVGQEQVIEELLIALLAGGHVLLIGVPGLAKTLMISTLAEALDLQFSRIQFTPDLMPSDITGTEVLEQDRTTGERFFRFIKGPIFGNIILADEINRTPPKTQAALLQAMQEHEVTAGDKTYKLPEPFFVLATQNPIEQEGTYPLPEAQLDRFMFNVNIDYPEFEEEIEIVKRTTGAGEAEIEPVLNAEEILQLQDLVRRVPVSDRLVEYSVTIANKTRPQRTDLDFVKKYVRWGAGPRASQFLILGAKTRAVLHGKLTPSVE